MAFRITACDGDSGGRTGPLLTSAGTVREYFAQHKPGKNLSNYRVTVNESSAVGETELTEGCRLNISPSKLAGAAGTARTV